MFVNFSMHRILLFILLATYLLAEEKIFVQEFTYQVSEHDSKVTSRANTLEQVKILLLEEASVFFINEIDWTKGETLIDGTYINKDIYEQIIKSIIHGITEINIIYQFWNTKNYLLKGSISLATDDIREKVKKLATDDIKEKVKKKIDKEQKLGEGNKIRENEKDSESDKSDTSTLSKIKYVAYDIPPKPIIPIKPIYPDEDKDSGIEGIIYIQFFIDKKGNVTEASVIKGIPNTGLDESALSAVKKSSWEPALQGEMEVGVWQTVPVKFEL